MEEIINIIVTNVSIWLPSLVSALGTVIALVSAMKSFSNSITEFKKEETIKSLTEQLSCNNKELNEVKKELDIVIDEVKKIKDYRKNRGA